MGWIGCVRCEKSRSDFMARTFVLIAPAHPVFHRVSCSYEMIPDAPKHYAMHQNMSLGSNGVDYVRSLRKIRSWLRGTSFRINYTNSPWFCIEFHAVMKWSEMHPNTMQRTKTWVYGPMWRIGCVRCEKSRLDFVACIFALIAPVHTTMHRVSCFYETIPNAPKHYATNQNMSLRSDGVDWVRSLWKIPMWLHGTNICINCTSSPYFAPSLMQLWNDPKCTQTICNAPKMSLGSNGVD